MLALSVSISTSSSPRDTSSPSDLSHLRIVPSSIESDRRGIATSAMAERYTSGRGCNLQATGVEPRRELEIVGGEQGVVAQDVQAAPFADAPSVRQHHGPLAQLGGERQVVGDDEQRLGEAVEHLQQLAARPR